MSTFIKKLKIKHNLSQDFLSKELGISRQTFSLIENEKTALSVPQAKTLAKIFNIPLSDFLEEKESIKNIILEKEKTIEQCEEENEIRISVPQKNLDKFKDVLRYILEKVGAKPNIGETVIYKLLYFIDFDFYEKYEEQIIGATYTRNHYGPTPIEFGIIIEEMKKENEIIIVKNRYFQHYQRKYLLTPDRKKSRYLGTNLTIREVAEKELIDKVLDKLSDMSATEISDYSHKDIPWKSHSEGEIINYESVFYRDEVYSVRECEDEL